MSGWHWFWAVVMAALVVWEVAGILGPFELDDAERPAAATRGQLVRAWCAGWLRRPREPLSFTEWMPHSGRMFLLLAAVLDEDDGVRLDEDVAV